MRFIFSLLSAVTLSAADKPNIVFILADDLGYGEAGCYGQEKIKTPHLDQLAKEGMLFTRHYTGAAVCAPARCVLMTGRHLGNAEIRNNGDSKNGRLFPGQWPITEEAITIAEALKGAGYTTGGFGKWGLGPTDSTGSPIRQGFDRFYGYNCQRNAHSFYPPFLDDDESIDPINKNPIPGHKRQPKGEVKADDYRAEVYAPDRILEEALEFLDENKEKPFFLYLPFVEPHVAMHPPQEWMDRYPKEWDEEKRAYRGQNGYLPHPRPRAGYASMISDLDEHIGSVLARLKQHGLEENTIVIFTSDNGATHPGRDPKFHIGGADPDFFNSGAGLRGWKGSLYEGGIRVPTIVRWPGKTAAGSTTEAPSYFPDWFPTLCSIAGAEKPAALDGSDLHPLLIGDEFQRDKPMVWEFHGYGTQLAVTDFPWKAIKQEAKKKDSVWELYHLDQDPNETTNLAEKHPEIINRLSKISRTDRTPNPRAKLPAYDQLSK
ncbi:arylsulfatase [Akkermansiaceae bacterium]|nr:arylsulfatase [Akkermansiaceae bacterium]MDB4507965.1 arylsulfatase [Akkermansiaceae bacterium]MDB4541547.1 arylsulfatase [Akkermansiaceae bacterium]